MSKDLWNDDQFRDGAPEFQNGKWEEPEIYIPAPDTQIKARSMAKPVLDEEEMQDEVYELAESLNDDDDDFTEVLSDARLRLEQGKLYEMILNHDLFNEVDADPRAVKSVQKQIRNFAKESMEVMLGMRSTVPVHGGGDQMRHPSPFNDLEVEVLKELASAATKGATKEVEENEPEVPQPKRKALNSIGSYKPKAQPKPLQKRADPIKRTKQAKPEPFDPLELDYKPLSKPIEKMTIEELKERDREAAERQANRKAEMPKDRLPMPDYATQEMLATQQVTRATTPGKNNLSALIVANLKNAGKI